MDQSQILYEYDDPVVSVVGFFRSCIFLEEIISEFCQMANILKANLIFYKMRLFEK